MLGDGPGGFSQGYRSINECGMTTHGEPRWVEALLRQRSNKKRWTWYVERLWKYDGRKHRQSDFEWLRFWFPRLSEDAQSFILTTLHEEHRWKMIRELEAPV